MSAIEAAWAHWHSTIETTRAKMLARPEARHPRVAEQAHYTLQAMITGGTQMYVTPRQDYPAFYAQALWSPYETPWGGPSSDMVYRWCFLDGTRTYRIWGKVGTTLFTDFHLFSGYFGDETMRTISSHDLRDFAIAADGSFEIVASPDRHEGNWLPLDPTERTSMIQCRETWCNWATERGTELHIECLDRPVDTMVLDEATLAVRITKAARLIEMTTRRALNYAKMTRNGAGGDNAFFTVRGDESANRDHGASVRAGYASLVWDIAPDEALVIQFAPPEARYWSLQLMDLWWGTLDFSYHQSGLNMRQLIPDSDGLCRAVLCFDDPGVANWLDPLRTPVGQCLMRWYDGDGAAPDVMKVKAADVRAHLPVDTPHVTPQQRAAHISARARASLARWGY